MGVDDRFADSQAEAGAIGFAVTNERFKYSRQ
jgi:hypothetical protein